MRKIIFACLLVATLQAAAQRVFQHPGCLFGAQELSAMRQHVTQKEEPFYSEWKKLLADSRCSTTWNAHNPVEDIGGSDGTRQRASKDATAAFYQAVAWHVTGQKAYADAAVRTLMGWAKVVKSAQNQLFQYPCRDFAQAAEMLRNEDGTFYEGWQQEDLTLFLDMVRHIFVPALRTQRDNPMTSWSAGAINGIIACGVLLDDEEIYNEGLGYFTSEQVPGSLVSSTKPSGQSKEMARDNVHAMLALYDWGNMAQTAWHQGDDLYGYADNRLMKVFDYWCRYNSGHTDTYYEPVGNWYYISNHSNGFRLRPDGAYFECIYHHYREVKGLPEEDMSYLALYSRLARPTLDTFFYIQEAETATLWTVVPRKAEGVKAEAGMDCVYLSWNHPAEEDARGFKIYRSTDGGSFKLIEDWDFYTHNEYTDREVEAGHTYYYKVKLMNLAGESEESEVAWAKVEPTTNQLPEGWAHTDIGAVQAPGSTCYLDARGGTFGLTGTGVDIWNANQAVGNVTYTMVDGDFEITTRVSHCNYVNNEIKQKMGIAALASLQQGDKSVYTSIGGTGTRCLALCWRENTGGSMQSVSGSDWTWVPVFLRLTRRGNDFETFVSRDKVIWHSVGTCRVSMPRQMYVGLFLCSGHETPYTVGFEEVSIVSSTSAPAAPEGLKATSVKSTQVKLSWSKSSGASSYSIACSTSPGTDFKTLCRSQSATTFVHDDLQPGVTYYYRVAAANAAGPGEWSEVLEVTTADLKLPTAPTGVKARGANERVVLTWNETTEQTTHYSIYRRKASEEEMTLAGTSEKASYEDTDVENDSTYYYRVAAVNELGEGNTSLQVRAIPTTGFQLYLPLDENEGTSAVNILDGKEAAAFSETGAEWTTGKYNRGVKLAAASQGHVSLNAGVVKDMEDFSVTCWVKPTTMARWMRVFDFGTGTEEYMFLSLQNGSNRPRFAICHKGTEEVVDGSSALAAGSWIHLAVTLQDSVCTLYVNGSVAGRNSAFGFRPSLLGTTTRNYLGRSMWDADPYLNGSIDEFRIYGQALTAAQVKKLYLARRQTMTMPDTMTVYLHTEPFSPAELSSGLLPSYASSRTTVARVVNGLVVPRSVGETTITAYSTGNFSYVAVQPKTMVLHVEATPDAIREVRTGDAATPVVYDLQGRRVKQAGHGIYIVNGRKMVR